MQGSQLQSGFKTLATQLPDDPFGLKGSKSTMDPIRVHEGLSVNELIKDEKQVRQSVKGTCYSGMYDDQEFRQVTLGPTLAEQMQGMYVRGKSVLNGEIEGCMRIREDDRAYYKDHIGLEADDEEPHGPHEEIVIKKQYDDHKRFF